MELACSVWKARILSNLYKKNPATIGKIADLGGGAGIVVNSFLKFIGYQETKPYVYDISDSFIDKGRELFPETKFYKIDIEEEDFEENYDFILLTDVLEHVKDPVLFLNKLSKKTKYLLIKMPIENNLAYNFFKIIGYFPRVGPSHPEGHLHEYNSKSALYFFKSNPCLEIISFKYDENDPKDYLFNKLKGRDSLKRWIYKMIYLANYNILSKKTFVKYFGGHLFVYAKVILC